jgi:hypothetical protein
MSMTGLMPSNENMCSYGYSTVATIVLARQCYREHKDYGRRMWLKVFFHPRGGEKILRLDDQIGQLK